MQPAKVVAILAASPALSSILAAVLAAVPTLRVRQFESAKALTTYMQLAPVDLLVCDFDSETAPAGPLAETLRRGLLTRPGFQVIALASEVTEDVRQASIGGGIDEVIIKPMSPKYLLERVTSRLKGSAEQGVRAARPVAAVARGPVSAALAVASYRQFGDNVIPLFGERANPSPAVR